MNESHIFYENGQAYTRHLHVKVKCSSCNFKGEGLTDMHLLVNQMYLCPQCNEVLEQDTE